ncbi:MAG: DUF2723 domain-containing protein [Bacteroidales bacterium]|nr:DUF2723 domain-containing protein [Bacteroidales bacterium]
MKKYNLVNDLIGWICFAIAAVTYLLTIEPTASFWDCPEFISQGAKLEVGHPPGNPIFMLTARFFVTLFGCEISRAAVAVNCMSALLSAATILLLFWTITHLVRKILVRDDAKEVSLGKLITIMGAGVCGALAYTWSDTFWFSAVEGEVYAFSSFCTALVFWLILKWENRADQPHSDRYLVLIAYVIGVSIAVHLLNLLCIPAIVLVFYYRKWKDANLVGSLISLGVSFVLVAAILYGLVPGFIKVAQFFEIFCVNTLGWGYNSGVLVYAALLVGVFCWTIYELYQGKNPGNIKWGVFLCACLSGLTFISDNGWIWALLVAALAAYLAAFCPRVPQRIFNVAILSIFVIFVGYSSYALLLIRASANTPMNQNAPDNVFSLSSYLNREQYGQRPLFYGPVYGETLNAYRDDNGRLAYVQVDDKGIPVVTPLGISDAIYYRKSADGTRYEPIDNGKFTYAKVAKTSPDQPDEYVKESWTPDYEYSPGLNTLFTRIYSLDAKDVAGYKSWGGYVNEDLQRVAQASPELRQQWAKDGWAPFYQIAPYLQHLTYMPLIEDSYEAEQIPIWKASFGDNLRYFLNYQLNHMYWRYFMWNFAGRQNDIQGNGEPNLGNWISGIPAIDNARLGDQSLLPEEYATGNKGHNVFYMLPLILGLLGIVWQALCTHKHNPERGIEQFWVVFFLFFMTGIAIVLYLNQTPGQPRERDYAFAGSFYAFAIWVGMGVPCIARFLMDLFKGVKSKKDKAEGEKVDPVVRYSAVGVACAIGLFVPIQMVSQTWDDHDRSHRYTTRDFGANYLNSLGPNAIIFTNGDNDTFPLWYSQEVEGLRTDVRVVNLSYLATDWYANQMKHPTYDAPAVKMMAQPTDYAYDRLGYSRVSSNPVQTTVPALEGLRKFYDNPNAGLASPKMYSPVDRTAVIKAFNLNPGTTDSIFTQEGFELDYTLDPNSLDSVNVIPYIQDIEMPGLAGGFSLSKLLSFDIIANSVADGFKQPVYFATTVPNSYYLGLEPYLYSTGVAQQVTPFKGPEVSPMAETTYENIMSKFAWGGLDDERYNRGLYLDETVRRMVSTMRNALIETADELSIMGDLPASKFAVEWAQEHGQPVPATRYDMARNLLNLMEEKMPIYATPYESLTDIQAVAQYLRLYAATGNPADLEHAEGILQPALRRHARLSTYAASLPTSKLATMSSSDLYLLQYTPILMGYQNYIDLQKKLLANESTLTPELLEMVNQTVDLANAQNVYPYVLLQDELTADMFEQEADTVSYWGQIYGMTGAMMRANEALGINPLQYADDMLRQYGSSVDEVLLFTRSI